MNYKRIYDEIISSSKNRANKGYTEKHHIIPRCMGGNDDKSNIAILTGREHFLCHWLLYRIYGHNKLAFAWNMMCGNIHGNRYVSRSYEYARKAWAKEMSDLNRGVTFSDERKRKLSLAHIGQKAWNKGMTFEKVKTGKQKEYDKNPVLCCICNTPISFRYRKRFKHCSRECMFNNKSISRPGLTKANSTSFKKGNVLSDETRVNISKALKGFKRPLGTCPHCGKEGALSLLKRWHFDNCKDK